MAPDSFEPDTLISDAGDADSFDSTINTWQPSPPPRRPRSLFQAVCMQREPKAAQGDRSL